MPNATATRAPPQLRTETPRGKRGRRRKLCPHYTPRSLWQRSIAENLRKVGLTCYWEGTIRRSVAKKAAGHCAICGVRRDSAKARMPEIPNAPDTPTWAACHEVWRYDFQAQTATVIRFELLCRRCNLATHIGRALAWLTPAQMDAIYQHIERVNETDREGVIRLLHSAERKKVKMDAVKWKPRIDQRLVKAYPALGLIRL